MQFMTLSRRRTDKFSDAEFAPHIAPETQEARTLYSEGSLRQIWRRGDLPGACILWEVDSEQHLRELLNRLPLVRAGMLEIVAVIPLQPYPGFGPR